MLHRFLIAVLCLAVAVLAVTGFALPPLDDTASHGQAHLEHYERHVALDGSAGMPDHAPHGHNPTDHSHEVPSLLTAGAKSLIWQGHSWEMRPLHLSYPDISYPLNRPPRSASFS